MGEWQWSWCKSDAATYAVHIGGRCVVTHLTGTKVGFWTIKAWIVDSKHLKGDSSTEVLQQRPLAPEGCNNGWPEDVGDRRRCRQSWNIRRRTEQKRSSNSPQWSEERVDSIIEHERRDRQNPTQNFQKVPFPFQRWVCSGNHFLESQASL